MGACKTTGSPPNGAHLGRLKASPHWQDGKFRNALPRHDGPWREILWEWLFGGSKHAEPKEPVPVVARGTEDFVHAPPSGLRITWLGHSTFLVEIGAHRVLVDPVWGERASPLSWAGPKRFYAPPLPLEDLPPIHAVVISHDHYDHLDHPTIAALASKPIRFFVPLGVGSHLEYWGVPKARITELDWWEEAALGDLTLAATPARHFSGRSILMSDADQTLWAGWVLKTKEHRVYYSGDTAMFPGFSEIGSRYGPFDAALIETGAYDPLWVDVHLGPEQALVAAEMVGAKLYIPVHWGCFNLAPHSWVEPIERLLVAAERLQVPIAIPRPGQSVEPTAPPALVRWWPDGEWVPASEKLVMSTGLDEALADRIRRAHALPSERAEAHPERALQEQSAAAAERR